VTLSLPHQNPIFKVAKLQLNSGYFHLKLTETDQRLETDCEKIEEKPERGREKGSSKPVDQGDF
jgi:hypothetical protein